MIPIAGIFGGWAPFVFVFRPYRLAKRMPRLWGIPRFGLTDLALLSLMLAGPLAIARLGRDDHGLVWMAVCFTLLAACVVFLWLRGLWILQQLGITRFAKRALFFVLIVPGAVLLAFLVGHWLLVALALSLSDPAALLLFSLAYGMVAAILVFGLRSGLNWIFGRPAGEPTVGTPQQ
jgi:hypothetical protein